MEKKSKQGVSFFNPRPFPKGTNVALREDVPRDDFLVFFPSGCELWPYLKVKTVRTEERSLRLLEE